LMRFASLRGDSFRGDGFFLEYVTFWGHAQTVSFSVPDFCSRIHVSGG
jgi:hypothetical protein